MDEKILIIHGWSPSIYWNKKNKPDYKEYFGKEFLEELSKKYILDFYELKGFFDNKPKKGEKYSLENYIKDLKRYLDNNSDIKVILARSFGAAVALKMKSDFNTDHKLLLFSPAIIRKESDKTIRKKVKLPEPLRNLVRYLYLKYYVKNKTYIEGDGFLRATYLNIVKIKLVKELKKIPPEDFLIWFGTNDSATPLSLFQKNFSGDDKILKRLRIIQNGKHNFLKNIDKKGKEEIIKEIIREIDNFI